MSDHLPNFAVKKFPRNNRNIPREILRIRSYSDYNFDAMSDSLLFHNWNRYYYLCDDVDIAWRYLFDEMLHNADFYAPYRCINTRAVTVPWYTTELLEGSIERDRLFMSARRSPTSESLKLARRQRNVIKAKIQDARNVYYRDLIGRSKGDPRKYWASVNDLMGKSGRGKVLNVVDPVTNELASTEKSVELINHYFSNIGRTLDDKLPLGLDLGTMLTTDYTFDLLPNFTTNDILDIVADIDTYKSSGCGSISMRLYKDMCLILCEQLKYLFNLSILTGKIPTAWKAGVITPLPKKGDSTKLNNIRPITITHICGKLLEKLVAHRLLNYLEVNKLLAPNQMGFRPGRSTTLAVTKLVRHRAQNDNQLTAALYIDFSKAFDCIKPELLPAFGLQAKCC